MSGSMDPCRFQCYQYHFQVLDLKLPLGGLGGLKICLITIGLHRAFISGTIFARKPPSWI